MKSILITGCNRGLGLGIVKQFVNAPSPPKTVIATCRNIEKAAELREIANEHKNVHILHLDVSNIESFDLFAKEVECIVGNDGLNILFNNAGYSPRSNRINFLKAEELTKTFLINTTGPVMLTKALLPYLKKAAQTNPEQPLGSKKAAVINMSSILGSIVSNKEGGLYPYRCSKAALNMATKSLSIDLKQDGILVTCVHPGWVKTDMGGKNAPMSIENSCSGLLKFIESLNEKHNGGYFQWDGGELPW